MILVASALVVVAILAVWAIVYALNRPSKGRTVWPMAVAVGVLAAVFYEPPRRSGYVEARPGESAASVLDRVAQDHRLARSR